MTHPPCREKPRAGDAEASFEQQDSDIAQEYSLDLEAHKPDPA